MNIKNVGNDKIMIKGYDPVSYTDEGPKKGLDSIKVMHDGVYYLFSSEENKERFEENPKKYIPAFGGYCATAISEGKTYDINPKTYKFVAGELYLFYNGILGDTLKVWNKEPEERTMHAIKNWDNGLVIVATPLTLLTTGIAYIKKGFKASKKMSWLYNLARIIAAVILLQTLYFKFSAHPESVDLFTTIGMEPWGRIGTGIIELFVGLILLFGGGWVWLGALGAIVLMIGAVYFHITYLGINQLFWMAIAVIISALYILYVKKTDDSCDC